MSETRDLIEDLRREAQAWREQVGDMPLFDRAADALESQQARIRELEALVAAPITKDEVSTADATYVLAMSRDPRPYFAMKKALQLVVPGRYLSGGEIE